MKTRIYGYCRISTMKQKIARQIDNIKKEYPEVWDLIVGAIGGVIGAVAGTKAAGENDDVQEVQPTPLDFDNMEGA